MTWVARQFHFFFFFFSGPLMQWRIGAMSDVTLWDPLGTSNIHWCHVIQHVKKKNVWGIFFSFIRSHRLLQVSYKRHCHCIVRALFTSIDQIWSDAVKKKFVMAWHLYSTASILITVISVCAIAHTHTYPHIHSKQMLSVSFVLLSSSSFFLSVQQ